MSSSPNSNPRATSRRRSATWWKACGVTTAGYYFGNIPIIKNNIDVVLILIVLISLIPMGIEFLLHRQRARRASAVA